MKPTLRHPSSQRGVALVITLFFVVLLTVIAVAFLDSAQADRSAASVQLDRLRAANMAREGIERSVATLRRETTDSPQKAGESDADYNLRKRNWISQPGALIVPDPAPADQKQLKRVIDLSSGAPTASLTYPDPILRPPNLNIQLLVDQNPPTYLITDRKDVATSTVTEMKLKWIYVRNNLATGIYEYDTSEAPKLNDKTKPIIGRFAYWTDDESSKINYNLAWKRDTASGAKNPNPFAHPSRINLMGLTLASGSPLTEPMADAIRNYTTKTPGRYFNSFADGRTVESQPGGTGVSAMLAYNKFELTHFNHDPDTTFFGENRILLTTDPDLVPKVKNADGTDATDANGKPIFARQFLDIRRDDKPNSTLDPGRLEDLAGGQPDYAADISGKTLVQGGKNKLDPVVRNLMNYISKTDWPLAQGAISFRDKFKYATTPELGQIAVNIIDYVRAKESTQPVIAPLRFALATASDPNSPFTLHPNVAYGGANSYQGICRAPYITEMGMYLEKSPSAPPFPIPNAPAQVYKCTFKMEVFLPLNYGFQNVGIDLVPDLALNPAGDSTGWFATWTETRDPKVSDYWYPGLNGAMVLMETSPTNGVRIMKADVTGGEGPNGTMLNEGKRVVISKVFYRDKSWTQHNTLGIRGAFYRGLSGNDGILVAPLNRWPRVNIGTQTGTISYRISDPATTTINNMVSIEVDDPRCNVSVKDWSPNVNGTNTFGLINSVSTLGKTPTRSPAGSAQQDTDASGMVSDHSFYMPPPKGVGSNDATRDNGALTSVAELGYIHTGSNSSGTIGSTPWRSIRLQPNNYADTKTVPDWAFMDLFAVPTSGTTGPTAIFTPHGTAVAGRVNVNSHAAGFDKLVRDRGLVALLAGTKAFPTVIAAEPVAANLYNRTLATGRNPGKIYGYPWTSSATATDSNAFDTPGEICEIKGVADTGEQSEDLIREIASLVTARGGVFNIYTIGQSLKQTPAGKLLVTAEQRQQAVVERYLDTRSTQEKTDDVVRLRTVYFRNLTP